MRSQSKLIPALIGGSVIAIGSSVPGLNLVNCLCCLWVLLGGASAVYFYQRELPKKQVVSVSEAFILGILAGLFGTLFDTFLSYLLRETLGIDTLHKMLEQFRDRWGEFSDEFETSLRIMEEFGPWMVVWELVSGFIVNSIFSVIGALITAKILRERRK